LLLVQAESDVRFLGRSLNSLVDSDGSLFCEAVIHDNRVGHDCDDLRVTDLADKPKPTAN
jgi:hypothetical protein